MLTHKIYYWLKPGIPRGVQIKLRRWVVSQKHLKYSHIWPIDEKAGKPPEQWMGWPDEKRFALVLTHDVDSEKGLERCISLARIEEDMGFRSSFNFVAQGYGISKAFRKELIERGFEIGIHGINHSGNPFRSRMVFQRQALRINEYLKEWGSIGFRSPSMYHNLEWICELDIEYDSSTFDTDPFEPQPDGVGTIFPFWVPRKPTSSILNLEPLSSKPQSPHSSLFASHSVGYGAHPSSSSSLESSHSSLLAPYSDLRDGYVELPYTLPQDFTLFVLMKERNIDIWKKKLDWIVEIGGMALFITHPDYMNFKKGSCKMEEYPIGFYEELLDYIKSKYEGQYWHTLPKEIARFWKQKMVFTTSP